MQGKTIDDRGSILTDPLRSFRFKAVFEPVGGTPFDSRITSATGTGAGAKQGFTGGFTTITGLSIGVQPIGYREGGFNTTTHQIPGLVDLQPINMQRGTLYGNDQAITWMRGLFAATAGAGLYVGTSGNDNTFRCNIRIYVMDHPNASKKENDPRMAFFIRNAWLNNVNYTELNASSNTIVFENLSFVHEGLSILFVDDEGNPIDPGNVPVGFGV
jgi:phage tail-like protein